MYLHFSLNTKININILGFWDMNRDRNAKMNDYILIISSTRKTFFNHAYIYIVSQIFYDSRETKQNNINPCYYH